MNNETLLFRWAHATDLHFELPGDRFEQVNPADPENRRLACCLRDLNQMAREAGLAFVVFSGDLSEKGSSVKEELEAARSMLEGLRLPWHVIPGNHDMGPSREMGRVYPVKEMYHEGPIQTTHFAQVFGEKGLRFDFVRQGYEFVGFALRDEDPDGQLDWLEARLNRVEGRAFVIGHYGLYAAREAGFLLDWGFERHEKCVARLRAIIDGAGEKVIAYFNGHNHVNSAFRRGGVWHISGGCVKQGCTGFRVFDCYVNRVEARFVPISDERLYHWNCWGAHNPGRCVDAEHPTPEVYHAGTEAENHFEMRWQHGR